MRILLISLAIIILLAAAGSALVMTNAGRGVLAQLPIEMPFIDSLQRGSLQQTGAQQASPASGDSDAIMDMDRRIAAGDTEAAIALQMAAEQIKAEDEAAAN